MHISELTNELPKLMLTNKLRTQINKLKPNDLDVDIHVFVNVEKRREKDAAGGLLEGTLEVKLVEMSMETK